MSPRARSWTNRSVAVTGAAGFIGSRLCRELLSRDAAKVTAIDALKTNDWRRLNDIRDDVRLVCRELDVRDRDDLAACLEGHDLVAHLAASTDMARGARDTNFDLDRGIAPTYAVLDAARQADVPSFLFVSSSAVYGELASVAPAREGDGPLLPISTYGASKLAGEGMVSAYSALFGMRARIVRLGTVIGAGMDHGVIPSVVAQLAAGSDKLELLGDGTQARSFVLVEDVVDAMLHVANVDGAGCEVFNVATHGTTSVTDVVRIVLDTAGRSDVEVSFAGADRGWRGDVPVVALDISRLEASGCRIGRTSDEAVRQCTAALLRTGVALRSDEPNAAARDPARSEPSG